MFMPELVGEADSLTARVQEVRRRIARGALKSNRAPEEVRLIAVTKTHATPTLRCAIEAGVVDLGENRVQEADAKIAELGRDAARWHLIGHLQSNKAKRAAQLFDVVHTLDSIELAARLDRLCAEQERASPLEVLIQVDLGGEATKTGLAERDVPALVERLRDCRHLRLAGLMTIPPFNEDAERTRPFFRRLRELRDEWRARGVFGDAGGELSMGMSHDYEVAVEEGATMVRVGTALFGARSPAR